MKYGFVSVAVLFSFLSFRQMEIKESGDQGYSCNLKNNSFAPGENLVYKVYYNWGLLWIPAGEAVFSVRQSENHFLMNVTGSSYKGYDSFFKIRNRFRTVVHKNTLLSESFVRISEEEKSKKYDSISFNRITNTAEEYIGKTKDRTTHKIFELNSCTHDLVSVLYYLRNVNLMHYRPRDNINVSILFDHQIYSIKVQYTGKEKALKIKDLGTMDAIIVEPELIAGHVFNDGDKMKIYVSDDNNRIPLLIESPLRVGKIKAILKSYQGLRHPFAIKINE
ncbi:MAG: DUF3108 domain-containing protein [Saprospiraceae bacterium]|nr:DUF3108 domain-containing protein [Saprospiraceae bacterium]